MKRLAISAAAACFGASSAFAAQHTGAISDAGPGRLAKPDYDLLLSGSQSVAKAAQRRGVGAKSTVRKLQLDKTRTRSGGIPGVFDPQLQASSFNWAPAGLKSEPQLFVAADQRAESSARIYLGRQADTLSLSKKTIAEARLINVHQTHKGGSIVRFEQRIGDIPVFGRQLNVAMDPAGRLIATSGYFAPPLEKTKSTSADQLTNGFTDDARTAVLRAFSDAGASVASLIETANESGGYTRFSASGPSAVADAVPSASADDQPRARKVYYYDGERYVPAYYVEIRSVVRSTGERLDYGYVISADGGKVLSRKNQVAYDNFIYRVFADPQTLHPYDGPLGNGIVPVPGANPDYQAPRVSAGTNLVELNNAIDDPQSPAAGDPWLPTGATVTTGNHVSAYMDLDGRNGFQSGGSDIRGTATSSGIFNYPYTIDSDLTKSSQRQAAAVNLFYMNNWLHDQFYVHGFDEASGNAQTNNYGRGGLQNDPINAEGQDYSGTNNANMSTPADGSRPRMQMYVFSGIQHGTLSVGGGVGELAFGTAAFGAQNFDISGVIAPGLASEGTPSQGCTPYSNAEAVAGKIALVDRGSCSFQLKAKMAQDAGAVAVIIINNDSGVISMSGDDTAGDVTIPAMMVSDSDGAKIRQAVAAGETTAHLQLSSGPALDGTMDNGIIAHEYCHYVTNRLIGDGNGLNNNQGGSMGEGWGDFCTLLLIVREEDKLVSGNEQYQGAYSSGLYVDGSSYFGIRRAPYSTNFSINPLTFRHIEQGVALPDTAPLSFGQSGADNNEVHSAGEVWANMLWEIYAAFLNDPRYSYATAKSRVLDYYIASLKLTPPSPTYVDARNAWIAAAQLEGDEADIKLIVNAFAKRGLGLLAVAPDRGSYTHRGVVESYIGYGPALAATDVHVDLDNTEQLAKVSIRKHAQAKALSNCDGDDSLDVGETAHISYTLQNVGLADIPAGTTVKLTTDGDTTISNGGVATLPAMAAGGDAVEVGFDVTLNSAATSPQTLTGTLQFLGADNAAVDFAAPVVANTQINYDVLAHQRDKDDMEIGPASLHDWTLGRGEFDSGDGSPWRIEDGDESFGTGHGWRGEDNSLESDITLESPAVVVGSGEAFTLAFDHYYDFEVAGNIGADLYGYDAGVIEISIDGGDWLNIADPTINAQFVEGDGYSGYWYNDEAGYPPAFITQPSGALEHVKISFGTTLAGKSVRIRFRSLSDGGVGAFGWFVDNVEFGNVGTPPFSSLTHDAAQCAQNTPIAFAGDDVTVRTGDTVTLDASQSKDLTGGAISFAWTQTSGPTVTLSNADTAKPSFKPTQAGVYEFQVAVTSATLDRTHTDSVQVTVEKKKHGGGAMNLLFIGPALLLALMRRRRFR